MPALRTVPPGSASGNPLWYKDAIIYEVPVRAFADSDGDGIGDFRGLTSKLDYLENLGVTAIWLLPFYPSPLRDDGYDISDYLDIHPAYGTLRDFKTFLREARWRGLKVITELVLNHTSDQHPWFQRARRAAPGSRERDFYVWSDTPDRYADTRIIFKDTETSNWSWDPVAGAYYWHRFFSHQPDLNYDNPEVRRAMFSVVDFWLEMGVDGLRLDAVPYLIEREGTSCENLPETHAYLRDLRRHVDAHYKDRMLLAEANQWPEDAGAYFGGDDECHMAFHFPLMPRLFMSIRMEDRFPVLDILGQTPAIPPSAQWAVFLRNHDELTLEMVTDEERDYMYRVYAHDPQARINVGIRRRLAPLLSGDRKTIELMNGLLFSMPGTPVAYYGDEIGMGDNIYLGDRNGVRTPMQWSGDRNAGFSRANPQSLYLPVVIDPEYHAQAVNVESQLNNSSSLLWWTKRLINLRRRYRAFGRGSLEFLYPENHKVLAYTRTLRDEDGSEEVILVVANLSRFMQYVELDLGGYRGRQPVELFGQTKMPGVGDHAYPLTLGPHAFYWFALEAPLPTDRDTSRETPLPVIAVPGPWEDIFSRRTRAALEAVLPDYLMGRRWFGAKALTIASAQVIDAIPVPLAGAGGAAGTAGPGSNGERASRGPAKGAAPIAGMLTLVQVEYVEGDAQVYCMPLAATPAQRSDDHRRAVAETAVARLRTADGDWMLYDALWDKEFSSALLGVVARHRNLPGQVGRLLASATKAFRPAVGKNMAALEPVPLAVEQSNSSVIFGDKLFFKLFRRLEEGVNPDLEVGRFLTEGPGFEHVPAVLGALEYRRGRSEPMTMGILQPLVANSGDAWHYTLDSLGRFFEEAIVRHPEIGEPPIPEGLSVFGAAGLDPPQLARETMADYLERARLLGRRTAELHLALASNDADPAFAPEPITAFYQRSIYQSLRATTVQNFRLLRSRRDRIPEAVQILDLESEVVKRLQRVMEPKIAASRIRIHGDYHLGQVLYTGKDFNIIDFEGEPARPLSERRIKRSPLQDVAGMLRSMHYAAYSSLYGRLAGIAAGQDTSVLEHWVRFWYVWAAGSFLGAYLKVAGGADFIPVQPADTETLLHTFLLGKAMYEVGYEANNRPAWIKIPIQGVLALLEEE
ncbi:MAG TPA: maltose alpha-D-glucosyltransferase [Actinomycetota bacterium]|nr:maltose alpha-D-glucosyltransferase [Actinomycetota bacterium]